MQVGHGLKVLCATLALLSGVTLAGDSFAMAIIWRATGTLAVGPQGAGIPSSAAPGDAFSADIVFDRSASCSGPCLPGDTGYNYYFGAISQITVTFDDLAVQFPAGINQLNYFYVEQDAPINDGSQPNGMGYIDRYIFQALSSVQGSYRYNFYFELSSHGGTPIDTSIRDLKVPLLPPNPNDFQIARMALSSYLPQGAAAGSVTQICRVNPTGRCSFTVAEPGTLALLGLGLTGLGLCRRRKA